MIAFINAHKGTHRVESICRGLHDHNLPIAPNTCYAHMSRLCSARSLSDERLLPTVKTVHRDNADVHGARTMWHALRRKGESVGRDQVERLMRSAGLRGAMRRRRVRRTPSLPLEVRSPELVRCAWFRDAPDLVCVCDFTHVRTRAGWMHASVLQDAFSRHSVGFVMRSSKGTELVTRTLLQAVTVRQRSNATLVADGVIAQSDARSQPTSLASTEKLLDLGLAGSLGRVGTAHDNALIESTIGLYETELVDRRATGWDRRQDVEAATARWASWLNRDRLHAELARLTPLEMEIKYVQEQGLPR